MKISANPMTLYAGLALLVVGYIVLRGFKGAAADVGAAAVNTAGGFVEGATVAIGQQVGIPATSQTQCQADLAAGNMWDASFSCSASDFVAGIVP